MTHDELFHHSKKPFASASRPEPTDMATSSQELLVNADLNFPLHFSHVAKTKQSTSGLAEMDGQDPMDVTPPSFDLNSGMNDSRGFLSPLLNQNHLDMRTLEVPPASVPASQPFPEPQDFDDSMHYLAGTVVPVSFTIADNNNPPPQTHPTDIADAKPPSSESDNVWGMMPSPVVPFTAGVESPTSKKGSVLDPAAHAAQVSSAASEPPPTSNRGAMGSTGPTSTDASMSAGPTTEKFKEAYPDLDNSAIQLFNYFRDKQSILMSVSPLNYFRSVFLAFALRYRVIMYGILAWASWHQGDQEDVARSYFEKASTLIRRETINSRSKEEILAALLILASAKICSGDTSDWRPYMMLAGETVHLHGGLTSFMESESVRWLLENFAYHEVLSSSSLNMPKLFTTKDFEIIFSQSSHANLPDTLCACCQPIFVVLERINELTRAIRLLLLNACTSVQSNPPQEKAAPSAMVTPGEPSEDEIERIYTTAHEVEQRIWALEPSHKILERLSESELRLQLTLFEVFKLVAVLHLYQSVLRINSASLSMRVVAYRLRKSVDSLFGTTVEGILIFPLFILGITSTTADTRKYAIERFRGMHKRLLARNITQALVLVQKVWEHDCFGEKHVDWNDLVDREGLHFSFC